MLFKVDMEDGGGGRRLHFLDLTPTEKEVTMTKGRVADYTFTGPLGSLGSL